MPPSKATHRLDRAVLRDPVPILNCKRVGIVAMQRQADQEQKPQGTTLRKPARWVRRSWGELLAAGLLILQGGSMTALYCLSFVTRSRDIYFTLANGSQLASNVFCLLGGIAILLRSRVIAAWFLRIAAIATIVFGLLLLPPYFAGPPWDTLQGIGIGAVFLFLARWIGRQEDIEG